jgi:hypothetical protein
MVEGVAINVGIVQEPVVPVTVTVTFRVIALLGPAAVIRNVLVA